MYVLKESDIYFPATSSPGLFHCNVFLSKFFEHRLKHFWLSSTLVVFTTIIEDNALTNNQSKISDDLANKLRHKRYTWTILITRQLKANLLQT